MSEQKSAFLIYQEWRDFLGFMNDEEKGKLLDALFAFNAGEDVEGLEGAAGVAFVAMSNQMDRDSEKYERKRLANRENGKKGGRPSKDDNPTKPKDNSTKPKDNPTKPKDNPTKPKDNPTKPLMSNESRVMSNESCLKHTPPTPPRGEADGDVDEHPGDPGTGTLDNAKTPQVAKASTPDDGFEAFWELYPRKVGKQAALKAWKKIRPTKDLQGLICDALVIQQAEWQWTKDNGQFVPNPSTWLNQGRWEDDVSTWPKEPPPKSSTGRTALRNRHLGSEGPRDFSHLEE